MSASTFRKRSRSPSLSLTEDGGGPSQPYGLVSEVPEHKKARTITVTDGSDIAGIGPKTIAKGPRKRAPSGDAPTGEDVDAPSRAKKQKVGSAESETESAQGCTSRSASPTARDKRKLQIMNDKRNKGKYPALSENEQPSEHSPAAMKVVPARRRPSAADMAPVEVMEHICSYLQKRTDVHKMLFINKTWMTAAVNALNRNVIIRVQRELNLFHSALYKYQQAVEQGKPIYLQGDPALQIRDITIKTQLPPNVRRELKPPIRKDYKEKTAYILSRVTNIKRLTIFSRPEVVRYCFRDSFPPRPETVGIKKMLKNIEHLGLAGCQSAGTDYRLDWLFRNVWTKLEQNPDGSWANPPHDAVYVREVTEDYHPVQKGDNKKGKPRLPVTYPGEQKGERYYTRLRSVNLQDVFKFNHFILDHIGKHLRHLEEIDFSCTHFNRKKQYHLKPDVGSEAMTRMLGHMENLRILKLSPRFLMKLPFLNDELHLSNLDIIKIDGDRDAQREEVLKVNVDLPNLEVFRLYQCPHRTAMIQKVATSSTKLRVVSMAKCGDIPPDDIRVLTRCSNLRSLEITHCGGYEEQLFSITEVIENLKELTDITLLSHPNRKVPTLTHPSILKAIREHPNLHTVSLTFNDKRCTVDNPTFETFKFRHYYSLGERLIAKNNVQKSLLNLCSVPNQRIKRKLAKAIGKGWLLQNPWPKHAKPYKPDEQNRKAEPHHAAFLERARPTDERRRRDRLEAERIHRTKKEQQAWMAELHRSFPHLGETGEGQNRLGGTGKGQNDLGEDDDAEWEPISDDDGDSDVESVADSDDESDADSDDESDAESDDELDAYLDEQIDAVLDEESTAESVASMDVDKGCASSSRLSEAGSSSQSIAKPSAKSAKSRQTLLQRKLGALPSKPVPGSTTVVPREPAHALPAKPSSVVPAPAPDPKMFAAMRAQKFHARFVDQLQAQASGAGQQSTSSQEPSHLASAAGPSSGSSSASWKGKSVVNNVGGHPLAPQASSSSGSLNNAETGQATGSRTRSFAGYFKGPKGPVTPKLPKWPAPLAPSGPSLPGRYVSPMDLPHSASSIGGSSSGVSSTHQMSHGYLPPTDWMNAYAVFPPTHYLNIPPTPSILYPGSAYYYPTPVSWGSTQMLSSLPIAAAYGHPASRSDRAARH
ncbi:hypothetical protein HK104_010250 [Borealophlyctis nickersoniae]|nr:hypothetical protein HK104_010250 [Borealophlyctis nickersoniae]